MDYTEVQLSIEPLEPFRDILTALLAEEGYESFVKTAQGLNAYIPQADYNAQILDEVLDSLEGVKLNYETAAIAHTNWNAEWEKDYHPVVVDPRCVIRALFHPPMPQYKHEIIIQPQMSFGTGHHPTTLTIAQVLLGMNLKGKSLLDLGTGTGVLAILAEQMGAVNIVATDIEDHIIENAQDNVRHNDCVEIRVEKAELNSPGTEQYEIILANINLNTLIAGLPMIKAQAKVGAEVLLSGFYEEDAETLIAAALDQGLHYRARKTQQNWAVLSFEFNPSA